MASPQPRPASAPGVPHELVRTQEQAAFRKGLKGPTSYSINRPVFLMYRRYRITWTMPTKECECEDSIHCISAANAESIIR